MRGGFPAWLRSRWLLAAIVVLAVIVWAVWQPDVPAPTEFWDPKP